MDRLHVATLNIRNLADRWFERLPLLLNDMAALQPGRIEPDPARADLYDALYREYLELHDHFGRASGAMRTLKAIRREAHA